MKVAIAGGGVIGLSIAWRAAQRGIDVTVIDPEPGRGASWVAGGMLAPLAEVDPTEAALLMLGLASRDRYPDFVAALSDAAGIDPGFTRRGTLVVARDHDDAGELSALQEVQTAFGVGCERLTSREARRLEPALAPTIRSALWLADDHQIDNRLLVAALVAASERAGVTFCRERCTSITAHVVAVASGSTIAADATVAATGAWPPPIAIDGEAVLLPVRPVKGQIVRVQGVPEAVLPTRTVRGIDVYVIPRAHGEIAIGATSEERGYDTSVTAGAVKDLLCDAWELLPGLAEATFVEAIAGLRPATPDNAPLIGRLGAGGPVVATGHYRHGVLLAPVTADAVVELLTSGTAPEVIAPFTPDRFVGELV